MTQSTLTEIFGYTASEKLNSLNTTLHNPAMMTLVTNLAEASSGLTNEAEQLAAEKLLAFYLDPNASRENDEQHTIYTAWTGLIEKLDKTNYPLSVPLIAAMGAKFEYVDLNAPLHKEFRNFRRQIAEPHNQSYQAHLATFSK